MSEPTDKQKQNGGRAHLYPNLRPFKPGQSGNPNGRPKGLTLEERFRKVLEAATKDGAADGRQIADVLVEVIIKQALKGNSTAWKEALDRAYGKVPDRLAGAHGEDLTIKVVKGVSLDDI